jgi:hypothetical protein
VGDVVFVSREGQPFATSIGKRTDESGNEDIIFEHNIANGTNGSGNNLLRKKSIGRNTVTLTASRCFPNLFNYNVDGPPCGENTTSSMRQCTRTRR